MNESEHLLVFTDACSKGHRLFGQVKYCPFCGVAVVQMEAVVEQVVTPPSQPVVMKPQKHETVAPIMQPTLQPENIVTAREPKPVQPPLSEPITASVPGMEQTAQPEPKQQHQIPPAQQPPLELPKSAPAAPLYPSSAATKKSIPMWVLATGGLIVLFALFQIFGGGKTLAPEQSVADASRPATAPTSKSTPGLHKNSPPKKTTEPFSAGGQPAPASVPESSTASEVKRKPAETVALAPNCPAGEISNKTRGMISSNNWGDASQFINRQLDQNLECSSNRELLMLQDMALELKKYMRDKNPRSAKSGFDSLIDKYGGKTDLTHMRGFFTDVLNKENNCAASGGTWDPARFACN